MINEGPPFSLVNFEAIPILYMDQLFLKES